MNILLIKLNPYEEPEMSDYFQQHDCQVYSAGSLKDVCQTLAERAIDKVFYNVVNMDDFTVIRYINEHYPNTKVVLISEAGMGNAIDNVRSVFFEAIRRPFHLSQLNEMLDASNIKQPQLN